MAIYKVGETYSKCQWKLFLGAILLIIIEGYIFIGLKELSISDKIQAGSIIALVAVTIYYAIQTQKLVKKQEESTNEERKRRDAEFADKKLQEFFSPMILRLVSLKNDIEGLKTSAELVTFVKKLEIILIEMSGSMEKYMYLLPYEDIVSFGRVVEIHKKALLIKDEKELKNWKKNSISAIKEFTPEIQRLIKTLLIKVSETFGFHDKKTIEKLRSQLIENGEE